MLGAAPVTWGGAALVVVDPVWKGETETTGATVVVPTTGVVVVGTTTGVEVVLTTAAEEVTVAMAPLVITVVSGRTAVDMTV